MKALLPLAVITVLYTGSTSAGVHTGTDAPHLFYSLINGEQHLCAIDQAENVRCATQEDLDEIPQLPAFQLPPNLRPFHYDYGVETEDAEEIPGLRI